MSNPVTLHCPHCGTKLKIKDRELFGQKVKCPGCKKNFVLRDPNEPASAAAGPVPKTSQPTFPDFSKLDADHDGSTFPAPFTPPSAGTSPGPIPEFPSPFEPAAPSKAPLGAGPSASPFAPVIPIEEELNLRRHRKKSNWGNSITFLVVAIAAGGIGFYLWNTQSSTTGKQPGGSSAAAQHSTPGTEQLDPNAPYSKVQLERNAELVQEFRPTKGAPIDLLLMPGGVNAVLHLRPAELWSDKYEYKVLRASLTDDVTSWLATNIKSLTHRDPAQIEELTIGVMFGARGSQPEYCVVVNLAQPEKLTALLDEFPGKYLYDITERPDLRIKVDEERAYLIRDEKTFAICPAAFAEDLEYSLKTPNHDVSVDLAESLQRTDRLRLATAVASLNDLRIHLNTLIPGPARPFFNAAANWFGEDVELVSWSVHPVPYFHSELLVRPVTTKDVRDLENEMRTRLSSLPEHVWKDLCEKLHPGEVRFQKLIGRLPAMLEAFQQSTVGSRDQGNVLLTTVLPAKAVPNLALATLFTITEAGRTNFAAVAVTQQSTRPKVPETVAERMKLPVDAEFSNTPFEQAVTYLCGEAQLKLEIDGDALKNAGYTKNMPQTFNLGKVPMQKALFQIVNTYQEKGKEMVITVNESQKSILIHTLKSAEEKGLPVFPLKPE